jgi:hypothetical protein
MAEIKYDAGSAPQWAKDIADVLELMFPDGEFHWIGPQLDVIVEHEYNNKNSRIERRATESELRGAQALLDLHGDFDVRRESKEMWGGKRLEVYHADN